MPPSSDNTSLYLTILPGSFFVAQFGPNENVPSSIMKDITQSGDLDFLSLTQTSDEISLVGQFRESMPDSLKGLSTWSCIKIAGPMEHDLTGIMADFTAPLKIAKAIAVADNVDNRNTDYVLVPTKLVSEAMTALRGDGWIFA